MHSLPDHLLKGFGVLVPDDLEKGLSSGLSTIVRTIKFACRQQDGLMRSCGAATKTGSGSLLLGDVRLIDARNSANTTQLPACKDLVHELHDNLA